jgi:thymidylate kinase
MTPVGASMDSEVRTCSTAWQRLGLPPFAKRRAGPFIVALEGPNGAGKTTLGGLLAQALNVPFCLGTDEAWFSEPFRTRMIRDAEWPASAMFFLSGCFERMRLMRASPMALAILDRCLWSTLAVHAAENPQRLSSLLSMLAPVAGEIQVPDFTLILEASFNTCQSRICRKTGPARVLDGLTANAEFHAREREFYRWLGERLPAVEFISVDDSTPEQVAATARTVIQKRCSC